MMMQKDAFALKLQLHRVFFVSNSVFFVFNLHVDCRHAAIEKALPIPILGEFFNSLDFSSRYDFGGDRGMPLVMYLFHLVVAKY